MASVASTITAMEEEKVECKVRASQTAMWQISHRPGLVNGSAAWAQAAQWQAHIPSAEEAQVLLKKYGYDVDFYPKSLKKRPTLNGGPLLRLLLNEHFEQGGHTWYSIHCSITLREESGGNAVSWRAPRRLTHLRNGLHDPVKEKLGDTYVDLFGAAHFAHHGGIAGTTDRLQGWLSMLANNINEGQVSPDIVALVLEFFQTPDPDMLPDNTNVKKPQRGPMAAW